MWKPMKLWYLLIVLFLLACNNSAPKNKSSLPDSPVYFPYSPVKSNSFDKGNDHYAKNVLDVWRQYETGNLTTIKKFFADSLRLILPDQILKGNKDSVISLYQKRRNGYSDMQCFIWSWLPVHRSDTKEDVVYVWGLYDGTKKNGDRDYALVHEIWRFDSHGKIREMEQFRTQAH
jgi:hypothetical protein